MCCIIPLHDHMHHCHKWQHSWFHCLEILVIHHVTALIRNNICHHNTTLTLTSACRNIHSSSRNNPTSKMLPARGDGRDIRTSNSLRSQTTVPTVCPRIHHPATNLPKPHSIATNPLKAMVLWELWKGKPDLLGMSQP